MSDGTALVLQTGMQGAVRGGGQGPFQRCLVNLRHCKRPGARACSRLYSLDHHSKCACPAPSSACRKVHNPEYGTEMRMLKVRAA